MSSLSAAAADRKSRLAALKSLKRKAPSPTAEDDPSTSTTLDQPDTKAASILSGRNYDPLTQQPRLGFLSSPSTGPTIETRAADLETSAREAQEAERAAAEAEEQRALDLAALQPKKANWDLRRELDRRMEESGLNVRTENAIARLVRERIEGQKKVAQGNGEGEEVGMEGSALVEATREREKEDAEEARRERELDAELAVP